LSSFTFFLCQAIIDGFGPVLKAQAIESRAKAGPEHHYIWFLSSCQVGYFKNEEKEKEFGE
jgi:hypothetical protein